jgi:hypothetical protein
MTLRKLLVTIDSGDRHCYSAFGRPCQYVRRVGEGSHWVCALERPDPAASLREEYGRLLRSDLCLAREVTWPEDDARPPMPAWPGSSNER